MTYHIHEVPGRIRVRTPVLKGNPLRAQAVKVYLRSILGVTSVHANTITGSILVHYDPEKICSEPILNILSKKGYLTPLASPESLKLLCRKLSISTINGKTTITHVITTLLP